MQRTYVQAYYAPRLDRALRETFGAGLTGIDVAVAGQVTVTVPDGTETATLDAFMAAQATLSAAEQTEITAQADWATVRDLIDDHITEAQQGRAALADAQWTPLTQAQKVERLRTVLDGVLQHEIAQWRALRYVARRLG